MDETRRKERDGRRDDLLRRLLASPPAPGAEPAERAERDDGEAERGDHAPGTDDPPRPA